MYEYPATSGMCFLFKKYRSEHTRDYCQLDKGNNKFIKRNHVSKTRLSTSIHPTSNKSSLKKSITFSEKKTPTCAMPNFKYRKLQYRESPN